MAAILVSSTLILLTIVGLNLFIALLSDTFQRVYDNAQANSLLEQVRQPHVTIILEFGDSLCVMCRLV